MQIPIGELSALGAALCWSFSSVVFTIVAKEIGALGINRMRLLFATFFFLLTHLLIYGEILPTGLSWSTWGWLGASGVVGLILGDSFLFQGYIDIGPRKTILLVSTAPIFSAALGWIFLQENLTGWQIFGILLTLAGVGWAIIKQPEKRADREAGGNYLRGVIVSTIGAVGQAVGLLLAKKGMTTDISTLSVTLIRMIVATVVIWGWVLIRGKLWRSLKVLALPGILSKLLSGSLIGPFLGIYLSMVAIAETKIGIAATLMAVQPIMMIPITWRFFHDRSGVHGLAGAVLAFTGTALLILF